MGARPSWAALVFSILALDGARLARACVYTYSPTSDYAVPLNLVNCSASGKQLWNYSAFVFTQSGFAEAVCIDLCGGGASLGSTAGLFQCNGGTNQKWCVVQCVPLKSVSPWTRHAVAPARRTLLSPHGIYSNVSTSGTGPICVSLTNATTPTAVSASCNLSDPLQQLVFSGSRLQHVPSGMCLSTLQTVTPTATSTPSQSPTASKTPSQAITPYPVRVGAGVVAMFPSPPLHRCLATQPGYFPAPYYSGSAGLVSPCQNNLASLYPFGTAASDTSAKSDDGVTALAFPGSGVLYYYGNAYSAACVLANGAVSFLPDSTYSCSSGGPFVGVGSPYTALGPAVYLFWQVRRRRPRHL